MLNGRLRCVLDGMHVWWALWDAHVMKFISSVAGGK